MLELSSWAPIHHMDRHEGYGMVTTVQQYNYRNCSHMINMLFVPDYDWEFQEYTLWGTLLTCVYLDKTQSY